MNKVVALKEILYPQKLILQKISEYANKINYLYQNKPLAIIAILNGAVFFTTELVKHLKLDLEIDFVAVSSYQDNQQQKQSHFYKKLKIDIKNKEVLILEDIIDSGKTIKLVYQFLNSFQPKNIRVCSLIMAKRMNEKKEFNFNIDSLLTLNNNSWIVGFGIDYDEKFRHLPNIYSIQSEGFDISVKSSNDKSNKNNKNDPKS